MCSPLGIGQWKKEMSQGRKTKNKMLACEHGLMCDPPERLSARCHWLRAAEALSLSESYVAKDGLTVDFFFCSLRLYAQPFSEHPAPSRSLFFLCVGQVVRFCLVTGSSSVINALHTSYSPVYCLVADTIGLFVLYFAIRLLR
jgi:hypothetical protein